MTSTDQIVLWAKHISWNLRLGLVWHSRNSTQGYWRSEDPSKKGEYMAGAAGALEFLRQHAGSGSEWHRRATNAYESSGNNASLESGVVAVADVLDLWANQVEEGMIRLPAESGAGVRGVASTDIMEQVRQLNADKAMHPAASIVLAGGALETALRGAVEQLDLKLDGKPSIGTYTRVLRAAKVITQQEAKDLEQMNGLRNSAAHGEFEALSQERAGLMEQQVNLFMAQLKIALGDQSSRAE